MQIFYNNCIESSKIIMVLGTSSSLHLEIKTTILIHVLILEKPEDYLSAL